MTFWPTYSRSTRHSRFKKINKARIRLKIRCLLWFWGAFSWLPKSSMTYPQRFQLSSQMACFKEWLAAWRMAAFLLLQIYYPCLHHSCTCSLWIRMRKICWLKASWFRYSSRYACSLKSTTDMLRWEGQMITGRSKCFKMWPIPM